MKFNFEKSKKLFKNTVMGVVATVGMTAPAFGAENPQSQAEQTKNTIENTITETTPENNAEVVSLVAEREAHIKKLEQEKNRIQFHLQKLSGELQSSQVDFASYYQEAMDFTGSRITKKLAGFETELSDLAMSLAEKQVGSSDITSSDMVNRFMGVLLSGEGEFKDHSNQLTQLLQNQLGSTVMMATEKPGKYISPDMDVHKHLSQGPRFIVEKSLEIVQEKYNLEKVLIELNTLNNTGPMLANK
jgi:hypothetical protein